MKTDSQTPDTDEKRPRRRRWRWVLWLLAILFLPTITVIAYKEYRYRREIALMRAEGLPTSLEELEAWRGKLKPEEDATDLWLAAAEECKQVRAKLLQQFKPDPNDYTARPPGFTLPYVGGGIIPIAGEPWPDLEKAEDYLSHFQECLDLAWKAMGKGGIRLPIELGISKDVVRKNLSELRRLMTLYALTNLHRGRADLLLPMSRAFLALSVDVRNGCSFLGEGLAGSLMNSAATDLVCWAISQPVASNDELRSVMNHLLHIDTLEGSRHCMVVESVNVIFNCPPYYFARESRVYDIPGWFVKDELLLDYRQAYRDCAHDYPECIDRCDRSIAGHEFGIISAIRRFGMNDLKPFNYSSFEARDECSIRQAMLAIAFRLYWDEFRKLPATLSELHPYVVARATVDPFTGKEFRYERKDVNRAVITGAGADRLFKDEADAEDGADLSIDIVLPTP